MYSISTSKEPNRKTASTTLVIENVTSQIVYKSISVSTNEYSFYFGFHPKIVIYSFDEYAFVCFMNYSVKKTFKFQLNVSILNVKGNKLFTKEFVEKFNDKISHHYVSLMLRSELLASQNAFLQNDNKLVLLCEIEVIDDEQESPNAIQQDWKNLSEDFQSLFSEKKFSDATLIVGTDGYEFNVHKNILAARSPVFAAMFEQDCEEKRQNKVTITDIEQDVAQELLRYIYTGTVKSMDRYAMDLLEAADKYQLDSLKNICEHFLCSTVSVESAAIVLVLADLHQATKLKQNCIEFISENVNQVKSTDGWKLHLDNSAKLLRELFFYSADKKNE